MPFSCCRLIFLKGMQINSGRSRCFCQAKERRALTVGLSHTGVQRIRPKNGPQTGHCGSRVTKSLVYHSTESYYLPDPYCCVIVSGVKVANPPTCYRSLSGSSGPKCPKCVPENRGGRGSVQQGVSSGLPPPNGPRNNQNTMAIAARSLLLRPPLFFLSNR